MKKVILFFLLPLVFNFILTTSFAQTQLGDAITEEEKRLGTSVAISGNGLRIAAMTAGPIDTNFLPNNTLDGYVKILEWKNNVWDQIGLISKRNSSDFGGRQIALSDTGDRLVIGTPHFAVGNMSWVGRVRVLSYDANNGWSPMGIHLTGTEQDNSYGKSVAITPDGSQIAIVSEGQYKTEIREWNNQEWIKRGSDILGDAYSVAMSNNGNRIVIGASYAFNSDGIEFGKVRVFGWNNGDWVQMGDELFGELEWAMFGKVVDISGNGTRIVVSSPNMYGHFTGNPDRKGLVKVYQWENNNWVQLGETIRGDTPEDHFGFSVSISEDGNRIVVGASGRNTDIEDAGQVKIFDWKDGAWIQVGNDLFGDSQGDLFGRSVGMSDDGNRFIVGSPGPGDFSGQVKVYDLSMLTSNTSVESFPLDIYPNPTTGKMQVKGEELDRVNVIDVLGRLVLEIKNPNQELDISMLGNGVYYFQCFKGETWVTRKVIKK